MKGPELQEPAYVLHRRPWRETSLMVDLFALNHGRMTVIARGANSAKSPLKAQLQPFQPLDGGLGRSGRPENPDPGRCANRPDNHPDSVAL